MIDAIEKDIETGEFFIEQEISVFSFDVRQATLLHKFAEELAVIGGPQAPGVKSRTSLAAAELRRQRISAKSWELIPMALFPC